MTITVFRFGHLRHHSCINKKNHRLCSLFLLHKGITLCIMFILIPIFSNPWPLLIQGYLNKNMTQFLLSLLFS